ncbi:MAG: MotA/TolQ/ExbB proton channel family protein [Lentisphaeria bacterium]|nr:MotA/TolQ/ExbB proton channel family protein [Lentisphaeria bacterium]
MNRNHVAMLITALALAATCGFAAAQPSPTAAVEPAGSTLTQQQEIGRKTTLWGLIRQGGWTMVPLGLLSAAAVGLIVYGAIATRPGRMLAVDLIPGLQDEIGRLHVDQAKAICAGKPCLMTNTLHAGLERLSDGVLDVESMEKAMEEASVHEVTAGLKPISYLSIIAQTAPMLGLLGTVSGMIKAFQKIGMGGMGKPELLATNIGEAMVTTAAGLIIGIPAMFFYFYLKTKFLSNVSEMSRLLGNLCHHLVASARRRQPGQAPAAE